MNKELEFETYLSISHDEFEIFLIDKINLNYLYQEKIKIEEPNNFINFDILTKFLNDNIFKIEKLIGIFIKNIILIIESDEISFVDVGIKKKNI